MRAVKKEILINKQFEQVSFCAPLPFHAYINDITLSLIHIYHREISEQLAKVLKQLISVKKEDVSVLIVGLGNRAVTPDALGPRVVDNLYITRHIINEYGKYAFGKEHVNRVSSIVPGVMAQTGDVYKRQSQREADYIMN